MSSKKTALTLLEVVAALALLATLLVALLTAHNRLGAQTKRAETRLAAIVAADQLMATWTATSPMVIPGSQGIIDGTPKLYWQVTARPDPNLTPLGIQIARLTVSDKETFDAEFPLATVEFLTTAAIQQGPVP